MILVAFVLLVSLLLRGVACIDLLDGDIIDLVFNKDNDRRVYKYQAIDKEATLTWSIYPDEQNSGEITAAICIDEICSIELYTFNDFFTFDIKTYNEQGVIPIDFVNHPVYFEVIGSTATKAHMFVTSSIILENQKKYSIDPIADKNYDYAGNNYMRYYRVFACDDDDNDQNSPGTISFDNKRALAMVYINNWDSQLVEEPGRPKRGECDAWAPGYSHEITKMANFVFPGWVFLGVDFSLFFDADEEVPPGETFGITPMLEEPSEYLGKDKSYKTDLCFYEDCYEFTKFRTNDFLKDADGNNIEFKNLIFLVMMRDKYIHENDGMVILDAMSSPETIRDVKDPVMKHGTDNLIEFSPADIAIIREEGVAEIYVAVTTSNMYKFPLPIPGNGRSTLTLETTLIKDTDIVRVGRKPISVQLIKGDYWAGHNPVYYSRLVFNTVGINKPYYLKPKYEDLSDKPILICDYLLGLYPHDLGQDDSMLRAGVYIGNGYAKVPYYDVDAQGNPGAFDYLIETRKFPKNETEGIDKEMKVLSINNEHNYYYQDGAYILDIIDYNYDAATGANNGMVVDVFSQPSWILRANEEYGKTLNASTDFDYFTFVTSDISHGVSIYVDLINPSPANSHVGVYASFVNPLPTANSKFKVNHYYYAALNISHDDIVKYQDKMNNNGSYKLYIAVDTTHKGDMTIIVTEGVGKLSHIGDGEFVDVSLNVNGEMNVIMFHSSELNNQPKLALTFEGLSEDWPDDVRFQACVDTEIHTSYKDCETGFAAGVSSVNKKSIIQIPLPDVETGLHPDYYVHGIVKSTTGASNNKNIVVRVFGEDYSDLTKYDSVYLETDFKLEPFVLHFPTVLLNDYMLNLTVAGQTSLNARFKVKICARYPSISLENPPLISEKGVRNCELYTLIPGNTLSIDLIGDLIIDEGTNVNDSEFISSTDKYVTIYPEKSTIGTSILASLYEDTHVSANRSEMKLFGEFGQMNYFRLHIISADSVSTKDMLSFSFTGNNPFYYCLSSTPHMSINSDNCISSYKTPYDDPNSTVDLSGVVKLTDLDPYYDAKNNIYAYFSMFFPYAVEGNQDTMNVIFSNSVVHYMDLIKSSSDNIDFKTYFFELTSNKQMAFYCNTFNFDTPFRFIILPDIDDQNLENGLINTESYTTTQIGIAHSTKKGQKLPIPTIMTSDVMTAGITVADYTVSRSDVTDEQPFIILTVKLLSEKLSFGLYKAGFFDASDNTENVFKDITPMKRAIGYSFTYDPTNASQETSKRSSLFYYPYSKSDMVMKVYPCAGIPGIYTSYLTPHPSYGDRASQAYPMVGHEIGKSFKVNFFDFQSYDDILVPTGFMFNATVEEKFYYDDPDPESNIRWDAEMRLVAGTGVYAYGGPMITNTDLRVTSQRGSEVKVEFSEAISGFSTDPTVTHTHIEYALFAMPAPPEGLEYPYFDASPKTHCGLLKYGFPITVTKDGKPDWKTGTLPTNADGSDPNAETIVSVMSLISNYKPDNYGYGDIIVNRNSPNANERDSRYNINVVAREINDADENNHIVVGYSVYRPVTLEISGYLPTSPGGLFGWEVAIIVICVLIVVGIIIAVVIICLKKKRESRGYGSLDGHGNAGKHGPNVELPDDDLSICASSPSSRSLTAGLDGRNQGSTE